MGLFDKLLKEGQKFIDEVATEENKEKAAKVFSDIKDKVKETVDEIATEENKDKVSSFLDNLTQSIKEVKEKAKEEIKETERKQEYYQEDESDSRSCREKILAVLASEFPQYKIAEDVSPVILGGTGRFMNYSIVVWNEGTVKLCIMLIGKTTTSHREYRWSKEFAERNGYPFINFVEHYPNRIEYITERLHKYL